MFRDPFVQKAWDICHQTGRCPVEIILEATMKVSSLIGIVTLTLFICYPCGLFAQEEQKEKKAEVGKKKPEETKKKEEAKEEVIRVEEVTVEAAPFKRPLKQHPGSATLIDRTEIEETGATSTTEVLRRVPGVNVLDEDGRGLRPDIGIRGLDPGRSRNVLILRDGVPVQPAMYGDPSAYYSVPIENLESIEIIKGASSVLYGTNTVGGVVNYITRPIPPRPTLLVRQTFGSNNLWVSDVGYGGRWNNVGLWGSFLRKQGDGFRERDGFDVSDASLRAELDLTASSRMVFNLNYYKEQSETPGGLTSAQFRKDLTQSQRPFDLFEGQRFSGDLSYTHSVTPNFAYQALIYGNFFERNWLIADQPGPHATSSQQFRRKFNVFGFEPRLTYRLGWIPLPNAFTAGLQLHLERETDVRRKADRPGARKSGVETADADLETVAFAAFVEDEITLPWGFSLIPGFRYTRVDLNRETLLGQGASTEASLVSDEFVPAVSLRYVPEDRFLFFANFSRTFKPPEFREALAPAQMGKEDLAPAIGTNWEIGTRSELLRGLLTEVTLFWLDFNNQLVSEAGILRNAGKTRHRGVEGGITLFPGDFHPWLPGFNLYGSVTFLDTEFMKGPFKG